MQNSLLAPQPSQSTDSEQSDDQYQGPTILSRDKGLIGERGGKLLDFRFYGEITGVYDSALVPILTGPSGTTAVGGAAYGYTVGGGLLGSKKWRHQSLSVEYHGNYQNYANRSLFNGSNQFLDLKYSRYLTRHVILDLKETAGTSILANGYYSYLPLTNTDLFAVPTNELLDNRTNYLQSRVDLTWQKTARLSFSVGGEGYVVRRNIFALAGLNGYTLRGDVSYRLSRRQTVTASYSHSYYDFQRLFGNAVLNTGALGYSVGVSRAWDFSSQFGISYVNTLGVQQVALDPAIAAIVGVPSVSTTFNRTVRVPLLEARLIRRFSQATLTFDASSRVVPGDGVFLTSRQDSGIATLSYVGVHKLTVGVSSGYDELSTLGQTLGKYTNIRGGVGLTYKIGHDVSMEFRYDYRHYTTQNTLYQADSNRLTLGFAFSPSETPLAIW